MRTESILHEHPFLSLSSGECQQVDCQLASIGIKGFALHTSPRGRHEARLLISLQVTSSLDNTKIESLSKRGFCKIMIPNFSATILVENLPNKIKETGFIIVIIHDN